ncbi:MAG: DUF58 domain-containing protein [Rhodobacterales bacterium]|nr:MAG: DUF58 domain-containing protein [Rhodobacterales bacterium]
MTALRPRAEALAEPLPPLLARARHLAAGVVLGEHGRRRPGAGDAFWQFRPARPGDPARAIDWRRSARSDQHFVQEKEWQAAQAVMFWVDRAGSMQFSSGGGETKADRAALIALAAAVLLVEGGERVGLSDNPGAPARGRLQLERIAAALATRADADYGAPATATLPKASRAVFLSDFLGPPEPLETALATAADRGVTGALIQVLDPAEEAFPFAGRTLFHSPGHSIRHETRAAEGLRARYLDRLAARKARLAALARATGWQFHIHHSDTPPAGALLWLYRALEGRI